jgi:hypothetical protein
MSEDLTAKIQELEDREAIKEVKGRYFRLVDEKDWVAWRRLFTDDATFDFGDGNVVEGADAFVAGVRDMVDGANGFARTVHHGHMPELSFESPTEAHGSWVLADYLEWEPDPDTGVRRGVKGYGHEVETYRKEDGEWKIATWQLSYLRMDALPREPLPEEILGVPGEHNTSGEPAVDGKVA